MMTNTRYQTRSVWLRSNSVEKGKKREDKMGAMRMSDEHLSDTLQICNWVTQNTKIDHSQNIRARRLINRIHKFITQTDRNKRVYAMIQKDERTAVLYNDD
jgi:hypothetical protein